MKFAFSTHESLKIECRNFDTKVTNNLNSYFFRGKNVICFTFFVLLPSQIKTEYEDICSNRNRSYAVHGRMQ